MKKLQDRNQGFYRERAFLQWQNTATAYTQFLLSLETTRIVMVKDQRNF